MHVFGLPEEAVEKVEGKKANASQIGLSTSAADSNLQQSGDSAAHKISRWETNAVFHINDQQKTLQNTSLL